ncbi:MAG: glycine cleavage system aminomethyltransferase GcvT [Acidimicrobiia bacterium]|nr:glycine cleavage system aminomethyltransferase GcvT [Acidimicrobiia bacterium]
MTTPPPASLKKTPLNARHRAHGARMVEFGGWDMPVEYTGIVDEHLAVRTQAGLFDVSHMGQIEIAGADALAAVQWISSNDASKLADGQIQYSALTTPEGTFVDDILVYRMTGQHFMLVVNAGNIMKDYEWIRARVAERVGDASVVNSSSRYALIAIQGPKAEAILQRLTAIELPAMKYYWFATGEVAGMRVTVSRTGYTGEDGFEVFVPPAQAEAVWNALLDAGAADGIKPCGLGARDTLRLEASMRLCGSDMDEQTTVVEAGLSWIVGWKKAEFLGSDVLRAQKAGTLERKLVGFEMVDRAIARHGYPVVIGDDTVGVVTSGTQTPFLKKAIGLAMVPVSRSEPGTQIQIEIRGRRVAAVVVPEPFYKRPKTA